MEDGEHVFEFVEAEDALGAAAELAWSLRSAEQEHADDSGLAAGEIEDFLEEVLVFGDAAVGVARGAGELLVFETVQREANRILIELHEGVSIVLLIAGVDQGIEREGIVLGGGGFLFDEGAQHPGFYGSEQNGHGGSIVAMGRRADDERPGRPALGLRIARIGKKAEGRMNWPSESRSTGLVLLKKHRELMNADRD
jgi:hypothetical protein